MKPFALLAMALMFAIPLAGCMGGSGDGTADYVPQTHEYTLYVAAGLDSTMMLYTKSDMTPMEVVAIPFKSDPSDPVQVPGPEIRVKEGDTVILTLVNFNNLSHTLHLHGDPGKTTWENDGVDYFTQFPVREGEEFVYTFEDLKAGTYWYHCHVDGGHHIDFGMSGAFIVEELKPKHGFDREYVVMLDEWDNCHVHGNTDPVEPEGQEDTPDYQDQVQCYYRFTLDNLARNAAFGAAGENVGQKVPEAARDQYCPAMITAMANVPEPTRSNVLLAAGCIPPHAHGTPPPNQDTRQWWYETHPVYNPVYNTFTVNGKAFPDSPVFGVREGERVLFRIINVGNLVHTWHPHGHTMEITHKDGFPWAGGVQEMDTLLIGPGERYDYIMEMDNPGIWMVHDQAGQYIVNDNVHPGGLMACFAYDGFGTQYGVEGIDPFSMERSLDCSTEAVRILEAVNGTHEH
jgi:plastocyanin